MIYENTRYTVAVNTPEALNPEDVEIFGPDSLKVDDAYYTQWYEVTNKETGVVELKTVNLIEAISMAAASDVTLENKPWEWYYTKDAAAGGPPELLQ